ncbi:hypothetical protein ACFQE1_09505 [Halobium palmae]|uniref:DUF7999 domain-containing protein n=1 Tax=Halobium palmae TaxID=1776492 RepID=A0ABD5RZ87_9EURY
MSLHEPRADRDAVGVTVVRPMNDHGGMTLEADETGVQYHVVEYLTPELRETLESLPEGASIPVTLRRLGARGNAWRAVGIGGGTGRDG